MRLHRAKAKRFQHAMALFRQSAHMTALGHNPTSERKKTGGQKKLRGEVWKRDHNRCRYCGAEVTKETGTLDHVLPVSRGGFTEKRNLVLSCSPCNNKKGNRLLDEVGMALLPAIKER